MPALGRGGSRQGGAARFHQRDNRLSSIVAIAPSSVAIDLTGKSPKSLMRMFGPARPSPPRGSSTPSSVGADPKPAISSRSSLVSRSARGFGSKCARFGRGFNPHSVLPSLVIPAHAGGNRKVDQNRRRGRSSGISSLVDPKWPRKTKRKSHWIPACAGMTDARVERADTWVRPYRLSLILQSGLTLKGGMIVDACGLPSSYGVL